MPGISVATYSFRQLISEGMTFEQIADHLLSWDVSAVEINNLYTTHEELPSVVETFNDKGIETILLTFDGNNFFQNRKKAREKQEALVRPWIDAAASAGIPMMRANMGHHPVKRRLEKPLEKLMGTFMPILEHARSRGITFVFENHGTLSSHLPFQLLVKERLPAGDWGFLLDLGNYSPKDKVYEAIPLLGNSIKIVHAKTREFTDNGEEATLDYGRLISLLKEKAGFDGYYSVEYEGRSLPPLEGIEKTISLLRKYLG